MTHIAIMKKSRKLLPKILAGAKTIESRWYVNKVAPWDKISVGDTVYFRNSGEPVTVMATASKVLQVANLDYTIILDICLKYGKKIGFESHSYEFWANECIRTKKRYLILIFLTDVQKIVPFRVNKAGFGSACAWMCVQDITKVKL